jgi:hypothetical protein
LLFNTTKKVKIEICDLAFGGGIKRFLSIEYFPFPTETFSISGLSVFPAFSRDTVIAANLLV